MEPFRHLGFKVTKRPELRWKGIEGNMLMSGLTTTTLILTSVVKLSEPIQLGGTPSLFLLLQQDSLPT